MYSVKPRAHRYSLACFCAGAHYIFIYFIYTLCMALSPKSDRGDSCKSGNNSAGCLDVLIHTIGT